MTFHAHTSITENINSQLPLASRRTSAEIVFSGRSGHNDSGGLPVDCTSHVAAILPVVAQSQMFRTRCPSTSDVLTVEPLDYSSHTGCQYICWDEQQALANSVPRKQGAVTTGKASWKTQHVWVVARSRRLSRRNHVARPQPMSDPRSRAYIADGTNDYWHHKQTV